MQAAAFRNSKRGAGSIDCEWEQERWIAEQERGICRKREIAAKRHKTRRRSNPNERRETRIRDCRQKAGKRQQGLSRLAPALQTRAQGLVIPGAAVRLFPERRPRPIAWCKNGYDAHNSILLPAGSAEVVKTASTEKSNFGFWKKAQ